MSSIGIERVRRSAGGTSHPSRVPPVKTLVAEAAVVVTESSWLRDVAVVRCDRCAREAGYAPVLKAGRVFCSVECAEAVAGLYLG